MSASFIGHGRDESTKMECPRKLRGVGMCDITADSGAESVWQAGWLDEEPMITDGIELMAADGHEVAHDGRKQVKFRRNREDGQIMSLDF